MYRPLWIEINLKKLEKNVTLIKKFIGEGTKVLVTVKQNAYGHGIIPVAEKLQSLGVHAFGVGSIEEAIVLREQGIKKPILILTALLPKDVAPFIEYKIIPTVVEYEFAKRLNAQARKKGVIAPIHIKVDTGMGRLGVWHREAEQFILRLKELKNLFFEGIFTHFPVGDTDSEFTRHQIKVFNALLERLHTKGIRFPYIHSANSIGLLKYKESHFNLVRPGLILYGIKPKNDIDVSLTPILSMHSKVIFLKQVPAKRSISYGRTFITTKPTLIATVAVGYADGYLWNLSNRGKVIIEDTYCKIRGRVCMDHIMVEVPKAPHVRLGSQVILIGAHKDLTITAEDVALWAQTIPYEVVSRLSPKIPRIYK